MKLTSALTIVSILIIGCTHSSENKPQIIPPDSAKSNILPADTASTSNNSLLGIWADGSSENAIFEFNKDSVYYVDQFRSYKYILDEDSVKIMYPDWTYIGKVSFRNDTLVLSSKEGISEFWKFKK